MTKNYPHEVLFFTKNTSLRDWERGGMFDREVALYKCLVERGISITFVTYGTKNDLSCQRLLSGIRVLCNQWMLPKSVYLYFIEYFQTLLLPKSAVFKSNQIKGADIALRAAKRSGHPFIARCGYLLTTFENQHGITSDKAQRARDLERRVFTSADRVVVTTDFMKSKVIDDYQIKHDRIRVIPNYVETDRFSPSREPLQVPRRVLFVGRLEKQKNLSNLINAINGMNIELLIAGEGSQKPQLLEQASSVDSMVRFLGVVPNCDLPNLLRTASVFILPSLYEGHPKALLEAMSCGLPVIGTNVNGIREIITHGETGYVCGTSVEEIRAALFEVLGSERLRNHISRNARLAVKDQYALSKVVDMEISLLKELV